MDVRRSRATGSGLRWRRVLVAVALTTAALVLAGVVDLATGQSRTPVTSAARSAPDSAPTSTAQLGMSSTPAVPAIARPSLPRPRRSHAGLHVGGVRPPPSTTGQRRVTRSCHYIPFGTSVRRVSMPPRAPVHATRLVLRVRLGTAPVVHTIVIALRPRMAPCAVNSVDHLARAGFYNRTTCPRVTTSFLFVLQCGDPSGTGAGGPGYRFHAELTGAETYPTGTVAMAVGNLNTTGSQFFVVYRGAPLGPKYPVIGRVVRGLAVVAADAAHGAYPTYRIGDGRPRLPVHIVSAAAGCAPPGGTPGAALRVATCPVRTLPQ